MKKENFWKIVAFISVLSFLILLKSRFQFSQDFSDEFMKSIFSREFISNLLAVAISGGLSIFILYKQSKHAEKNLEIQIKNQEQQLNQQMELSKYQFESQQYLEIKKIELKYNIENLENIKKLLNELSNITENKIKPLTELVFKQHDYWHNPAIYDVPPIQENWDRDYKYYSDLMTRVHAINNELSTFASLLDGKIHYAILDFINSDFGLLFYKKQMTEVWEVIEKHRAENTEINYRDENVEYVVTAFHIYEKIIVLTQSTIPIEINRNIKELKKLFVKEKKDTK
ncbi:hypothetical protein [Streptococcus uberis]|uniref:hypothetical protein n=1 Tax=Streptococcus uberis TaxID=1349 RepID=UPI003EF89C13